MYEYVSAGVSLPCNDRGVWHHVRYFLKRYTPPECNDIIYDMELMTMIEVLEKWRSECEGAVYLLQLIPDHRNTYHVMTKTLLNRR
jgi:hypothetical protein